MLGGVLPKSRCRFLHSDLGNTEVVPWDVGKKHIYFADVRVQKFACGPRKQPYYYGNRIFYHDFSRNGSGSFMLRFRQKKMPIFWLGETPNPSQPQIRRITTFYFICYLSTQPKKHIWTTIELVIVCSDWYFHEWKGKWMKRQTFNPVLSMTTEWRIKMINIETSKGH